MPVNTWTTITRLAAPAKQTPYAMGSAGVAYTLGTAAKAAGKSKATISRAIARGKLSATQMPTAPSRSSRSSFSGRSLRERRVRPDATIGNGSAQPGKRALARDAGRDPAPARSGDRGTPAAHSDGDGSTPLVAALAAILQAGKKLAAGQRRLVEGEPIHAKGEVDRDDEAARKRPSSSAASLCQPSHGSPALGRRRREDQLLFVPCPDW